MKMYSNTLSGVFPEPKPVHRKNFIRENVRYIKEMQGLVQSLNQPRYSKDNYRFNQHAAGKVSSNISPQRPLKNGQLKETFSTPNSVDLQGRGGKKNYDLSRQNSLGNRDKLQISQMRDFGQVPRRDEDESPERFTDRSVQTEKSDDVRKIYQNGVIKFASNPATNPFSGVKKSINNMSNNKVSKQTQQRHQDRGDSPLRTPTKEVSARMQCLEMEDRDFIKENMKAIRQRALKNDSNHDPNRAPPNYQRGVLPKYLKERKGDAVKEVDEDPECPPGHVLLPDEERKETLRVLRQSYADRIQELNSMPVRNDTLKMRRRKMDLEEELKKIDEGIKVFQRPKVFVKINA